MERPTDDERKRLGTQYKALVDGITEILYHTDPVGIGAGIGNRHLDEYSIEAVSIARSIPEANDASDVQRIVHPVFEQYFGPNLGAPLSAYAEPAKRVWSLATELRKAR